ncbi:MAG: hypothetical protein Q8R04_06370 [Nanoarchaeota archaeon]|nr:hypothetical protein [Nanoarchaeota archaeon]
MISLKDKGQSNELFFVEVKEPNEVRRNILEVLKEIVEVMKRFENFKHLRQEKLENIHKLKGLLKEANKTLGNLKLKMPQTNLRVTGMGEVTEHHRKSHHKKKKKGKHAEEKVPKREMTELEKLETELTAIEDKLKGLT